MSAKMYRYLIIVTPCEYLKLNWTLMRTTLKSFYKLESTYEYQNMDRISYSMYKLSVTNC